MKKQFILILTLSGALLYGCADRLPEKETVTLPAPESSFAQQSDAAPLPVMRGGDIWNLVLSELLDQSPVCLCDDPPVPKLFAKRISAPAV